MNRSACLLVSSCAVASLSTAWLTGCGASSEPADARSARTPRGDDAGTHGGDDAGTQGGDDAGTQGGDDDRADSGDASAQGGGSGENSDLPRFGCSEVRSQQFDSRTMEAYRPSEEVTSTADSVLESMDWMQRGAQMMGVDGSIRNYRDINRSSDAEVPGLGTIRGFRFRDGGRGVNLDAGQDNRPSDGDDFSTVFPAESLRGASWDVVLERRIGAAIADEAVATSNNALYAPTADLIRHPFWGRTQDSYGEDAYLVGRMATAFAVGAQEYVMACAKHFAGYNVEKQRSSIDARMTEQALREVHTRQFEMVVQDGGVGCVMAAYNLVNGTKVTQNRHLLREVLKAPVAEGGMGFQGVVITDLWAMPGDQTVPDPTIAHGISEEAVHAGTDIELPWMQYYNAITLGLTDQSLVEDAARRILTQKIRFDSLLGTDPGARKAPRSRLVEGTLVAHESHELLAEEAALKSIVLLTNGLGSSSPVLPLTSATNIAVVGPKRNFRLISSSVPKSCNLTPSTFNGQMDLRECTLDFATDAALGDRGSSRVNGDPSRTMGPFAGIQEVAGPNRTVVTEATADPALTEGPDSTSIAVAKAAEAVVVVVGYTPEDEGEEFPIADGGDRTSLGLDAESLELVTSVLDLDKPTVIVVESGTVVDLPWLAHSNQNQATLWAGYPGLRGGVALGRLIFGEANFSGKLPVAWVTEAELPPFLEAETSVAMGYFFGYREFDRRQYVEGEAVDLVFPFGHGLSYASYEYSNLTLPCETASADAIVNVTVDITNTSDVDGEEVAMLFVKPPPKPAGITGERPWKELKSFARVAVAAGETVTAELPLRIRDLRRWEGGEDGEWVIDEGDYTLIVAKNAADAETRARQGTLSVSSE